jgi:fatty-acyl-CoA synthase
VAAKGADVPAYKTIAAAIPGTAAAHPRNGFVFQNQRGEETGYTFGEIEAATASIAANLQALGLSKGDRIGLVAPEPEHFVLTFLAAIRAGIVPVPIYPPYYIGSLDTYVTQSTAILRSARPRALVAAGRVIGVLEQVARNVDSIEHVVTAESLRNAGPPMRQCTIDPDDTAFLQYTSGSTTEPRGVIVTHRSVVSNVHCFMGEALHADAATDKGVSWLPLYHDMGLVGFVLGPIYWGVSVVFIPTLRFIKSPSLWIETLHAHRATITFAPNFAFSLLLRRARAEDLRRWDLSAVKAIGCGAEPIRAEVMHQFIRVFGEHCRLDPGALMPAYGLAECTLAAAIKRLPDRMRTQRIDRDAFEATGIARAASADARYLEHVSCGAAFDGHRIGIRGPDGNEVPAGHQGEVWIKGPSVCAGYAGNPEAWSRICQDGWLNTGDLGYLWNRELYVSGRSKDLIILNGRNLHPQEIEWAVGKNAPWVRTDCVVAFSVQSDSDEQLIVAVETRNSNTDEVVAAVEKAVQDATLACPSEVICLPPGSLPRTSSGKLRRKKVQSDYLSGRMRSAATEPGGPGTRVAPALDAST